MKKWTHNERYWMMLPFVDKYALVKSSVRDFFPSSESEIEVGNCCKTKDEDLQELKSLGLKEIEN